MGLAFEDWQIPPFTSLLRTVVVDLAEAFTVLDNWEETLSSRSFRFSLAKAVVPKQEHEPVSEYLERIAETGFFRVTIEPGDVECVGCVMTVNELYERVEELTLPELAGETRGD